MASVEIRDHVIWLKHIHDDAEVVRRLSGLSAGQTVELVVDGVRGWWRRMADQPSGAPTPGLTPLSQVKPFWQDLYRRRRGDLVKLEASSIPPPASDLNWTPLPPHAEATEADRQEALRRLLSLAGMGWRSDGRNMTRDEMNER